MEITRDKVKKAATAAGIGVVGVGIGLGASTQVDSGPTQKQHQNLQEKIDDLESRPTQEELNEIVEDRQEQITDLKGEVDSLEDRPTVEEYSQLQKKVSERFTQEEVNDLIADATEREGLVDYLPVLVDEDIEVENGDINADSDETVTDGRLEDDIHEVDESDFDSNELDGEDFDEVTANYTHDDGHEYEVVVREFEDSEDADEYVKVLEEQIALADYDESIDEDATVIRNGETVVYLYGNATTGEYQSYDFYSVKGQY